MTPTTIGINVIFMFYSFLNSLAIIMINSCIIISNSSNIFMS